MYDKDFAELVKIAAEKLKEDTVYKMLTRSEDYQKESDARDKAERNYENLDLTMEQRKVCDIFLDYRDRQSLEYSDYSYLAGLYDAFRIMAVIFPDRWDMEQIQKALSLIKKKKKKWKKSRLVYQPVGFLAFRAKYIAAFDKAAK